MHENTCVTILDEENDRVRERERMHDAWRNNISRDMWICYYLMKIKVKALEAT